MRSSLRSPDGVGIEEERVVHFARRMAGGEIQLGEIVVVALDVRPFGDGKAHVGEDGGEFVHHLADGMDAAGLGGRVAHGQRHVHALGGEPRFEGGFLQHRAARVERLADIVLERVDGGAGALALVGRHLAERRQQGGDRALLAERRDAHGLERRFVACGGDRGKGFGLERVQIGHGAITGGGRAGFCHGRAGLSRKARGGGEGANTRKARLAAGLRAKVSRACDQITRPSAARPWPARRWP